MRGGAGGVAVEDPTARRITPTERKPPNHIYKRARPSRGTERARGNVRAPQVAVGRIWVARLGTSWREGRPLGWPP